MASKPPKILRDDRESLLQQKIIKWLRSQGCRVVKCEQNATTRTGTPDIIFMKEQFWGVMEFKKAKNSPKRPGQQEWVDWANENSWGAFVYPANWSEIQKELESLLK